MIIQEYQTKEQLDIARQNFFSKLFSKVIFQNKIVSTVLNNVSKQLIKFQKELDNQLNHDV